MMKYSWAAVCFVLCAVWAGAEPAAVAPEIAPENAAARTEVLRIRVCNRRDGAIEVSRNRGADWLRIGSVTAPALHVNALGYTASKWARDSAVAATAVNGIHIKVRTDATSGRGVIFSLAPGGKILGEASNEIAGSAVILTDVPGGEGIFGGGLGPYVNDPVTVCRQDTASAGCGVPLPPDYVPTEGDVLYIVRSRPLAYPLYVSFENKFGGLIRVEYAGQAPRVIGQVLRPVCGIGRFEGETYAGAGRVRANHCGVIDVSTAPEGSIGGFQIIPREHAGSPEMYYVKERTQWMVIGPVSALSPSFEGQAPLFSGYLLPSYRPDDIVGGHANWMERTLSRCMVECRLNGGPWQPLPHVYFDASLQPGQVEKKAGEVRVGADMRPYIPLPGTADSALKDVSDLRIVLPMADFWPTQ